MRPFNLDSVPTCSSNPFLKNDAIVKGLVLFCGFMALCSFVDGI